MMDEQSRKCVLVAEDDDDIRALVECRLTLNGYEVVAARDGEEAVQLAGERDPDLMILDVMLPRLDGLQVTRRLRADGRTARLPIILLTARAQEADVTRGFEAGADDYLRKPFSSRDLAARVQAIIGG